MHSIGKQIAIRIMIVLLVSLFAGSSALASTTATVNCDALNVRDGASTSAKRLGALPRGTQVEILATTGRVPARQKPLPTCSVLNAPHLRGQISQIIKITEYILAHFSAIIKTIG